jgi:hypothetical protein
MHRCTVILVLILEFTTYLGDVFLNLIAAFRSKAEKGGKGGKSEDSEKKGRRKGDREKC